MKRKTIKNYIFNLIYQVFTLITPLITTPYVSRILGSSGVGQYSYSYSIASYMIMFGSLGFGYYAQREIARNQGDEKSQSKILWEIIIARAISVTLSLIVFVSLIASGVFSDYTSLMWILTINVIATAFDISFFFQGNEKFGTIAIRNIIVKCIGIALIFIFVKNNEHVWLYTLCHVLIVLISNLSLWPQLFKYLKPVKISELNFKRHYPATLRLFIPTIAVSVYTMLDKSLIGWMVKGTTTININGELVIAKISDIENGFYEQSEKLVKMATTIVGVLGTVMLPRNSNAVESGNKSELRENIFHAFNYVFFIGVPISFGLAAVASNIVPWFFGSGYEKVITLIYIFSPLALILGLSNVIGIQYLIPSRQDKKYTISTCSGAVFNLALNLILITNYLSIGAAISSIIAEILVTTIMFVMVRKEFNFISVLLDNWKYLISGAIMFATVFVTNYFLDSSIMNTSILIIEGILVYVLLLVLLRDKFLMSFFKKKKKTIE